MSWAPHTPSLRLVRRRAAFQGRFIRLSVFNAQELGADRILIDEKAARAIAETQGLRVTGTLGVLALASKRGLIDLRKTVLSLVATSFHIRDDTLDASQAIWIVESKPSIHDLGRRARSGDRDAFSELADAHADSLETLVWLRPSPALRPAEDRDRRRPSQIFSKKSGII